MCPPNLPIAISASVLRPLIALALGVGSVARISLSWNLFDWHPRYDWEALLMLALWSISLVIPWLGTRHRLAKTELMTAWLCAGVLLSFAVTVLPADIIGTGGYFSRTTASPLVFRLGLAVALAATAASLSVSSLRTARGEGVLLMRGSVGNLAAIAVACAGVTTGAFLIAKGTRHAQYDRVTEYSSYPFVTAEFMDRMAKGLEAEVIAPCRNRGPGLFAMSEATCTEVIARRRADETQLAYWAGTGSGIAAACLGWLAVVSLFLVVKMPRRLTGDPSLK